MNIKNVKTINLSTDLRPIQQFLESKDWYDSSLEYYRPSTVNKRSILIDVNNFIKSRFNDQKTITSDNGIKKLFRYVLEVVFEPCYQGKFNSINIIYSLDIDSNTKINYRQTYSIEINKHLKIYPELEESNQRLFTRDKTSPNKGWSIINHSDF